MKLMDLTLDDLKSVMLEILEEHRKAHTRGPKHYEVTEEIERVFQYYREKLGLKRYDITPARTQKVGARIEELGVTQVLSAIDRVLEDDWPDRIKHRDLADNICHSREQCEKWNLRPVKGSTPTGPKAEDVAHARQMTHAEWVRIVDRHSRHIDPGKVMPREQRLQLSLEAAAREVGFSTPPPYDQPGSLPWRPW